MPKEDKVYRLVVGTFDEKKNETNWHDVYEFDDFDKAQKEFRKYVAEQLKYSDEEFDKVWKTPRLDIELVKGDTLMNWAGVYARGNKADIGDAWENSGYTNEDGDLESKDNSRFLGSPSYRGRYTQEELAKSRKEEFFEPEAGYYVVKEKDWKIEGLRAKRKIWKVSVNEAKGAKKLLEQRQDEPYVVYGVVEKKLIDSTGYSVKDAAERKFMDEYGHIITEDELYDEFKLLKAEEPKEYNYSFEQYVANVTGKNGTLTVVKDAKKKRDFAVFGMNDKGFKKMLTHGFETWEEAQEWIDGYDGRFIDGNDESWLLGISEL